jgi:hypothetical protein
MTINFYAADHHALQGVNTAQHKYLAVVAKVLTSI